MRRVATLLVILCLGAAFAVAGCANRKETMDQLGRDVHKALETTGKVIEGAGKGAVEALKD